MGFLVELEELGQKSTKSGQSKTMKLSVCCFLLHRRILAILRFESPLTLGLRWPQMWRTLCQNPQTEGEGIGDSLVNISHFAQKTFTKYNLFPSKSSYTSVDGHESEQHPGGGIQPQGVVSIFDSAADYKVEGSHPCGPFSLCTGYFQQICYIKYSPCLPVCFPAK